MQIYLVGGAIRDGLLGLPVKDKDWVVVGATPQAMLAQGYSQVGKDFPVFLHPKTKEEYALARMERKVGQGYHGFEMSYDPSVTLEEDLVRRDLTINAIAQDSDGILVDPYGGQADLQAKVLRHVSEAFAEDPLRVLRVARFAAKLAPLGFSIAPETLALMTRMTLSGELAVLTPERVWQEMVKVLALDKPSVFFNVLQDVGALDVLFAELAKLQGVEQPVDHHPEGDVWTHTLMVLDTACVLTPDLDIRFAALVHDLGKGLTPKEYWPKHHGHELAGVPLVKAVCERFRVPNKTAQLAYKVTEFHGLIHHGLTKEGVPYLKPATFLKVLNGCLALKQPAFFAAVLLACEADAKGRLGFEQRNYLPRVFWRTLADKVNGLDNQTILADGLEGAAIGLAIEQARLNLIAEFIHDWNQAL